MNISPRGASPPFQPAISETPALHRLDCESTGFEWIDASDTEQNEPTAMPTGPVSGAAVKGGDIISVGTAHFIFLKKESDKRPELDKVYSNRFTGSVKLTDAQWSAAEQRFAKYRPLIG